MANSHLNKFNSMGLIGSATQFKVLS